jgi:hypothetical protein
MKIGCSILLLSIIILGCSSPRKLQPLHLKDTPGAIGIDKTLMCDETEISNFTWLEYLYWIDRAYGTKSPEYVAATPFTDDSNGYTCLQDLNTKYLRDPKYRNHPVLGISQKQAREFSEWRSDRVFEYYLIKNGYLDYDVEQRSPNLFTREKYFNGTHVPTYLADNPEMVFIRDTTLMYPIYRLPTFSDRQLILDYVDSTDYAYQLSYPKDEKEAIEHDWIIRAAISPCDSNRLQIYPTVDVNTGFTKKKRVDLLLNTRGNVAEWLSEENLTAGGGWAHTLEYILVNDTISSYEPNEWTGFRNVCTWKKYQRQD